MLRSKMFSIFYTPVHTSVQGKNRNNTVLYLAGNFINIGLMEDDADLHFFISRSGFEKKTVGSGFEKNGRIRIRKKM